MPEALYCEGGHRAGVQPRPNAALGTGHVSNVRVQERHKRQSACSYPWLRPENCTKDPEYVITTNTVEGYYSIFKRGMKGVYQHCKEKHLHRYLAEFDFRYSNRIALGVDDVQRTERALRGVVGKRLTYRTPHH
jgi:hypothetical protein